MAFVTPIFAFILLLVPVLLYLHARAVRKRRAAIAAIADPGPGRAMVPDVDARQAWLRAGCMITAVAMLGIAMMEPQWGRDRTDVARQGRDIMVLLDVSLSMLAEDAETNRLESAKTSIRDMVQAMREDGGHRVGLIAFAGRAGLHCPISRDYRFFLQRLDEADPPSVPLKGTVIGDAIRQALYGFGELAPEYTDLILVTDGEDHDGLALDAAQSAADEGVSIHTVGIGDPGRGAPIPISNRDGTRSTLKVDQFEVKSTMQQGLLLEIARLTDGEYVHAGTGAADLVGLYKERIAPKPGRDVGGTHDERRAHRYYWFVAIGLLLLGVELVLSHRRLRSQGAI